MRLKLSGNQLKLDYYNVMRLYGKHKIKSVGYT
jgi:hypothetical protein